MTSPILDPRRTADTAPEATGGGSDEQTEVSADLHLYTAVQLVAGHADGRGRRLSDVLNDRDSAFLTLHEAALYDLLDQGEASVTIERLTIRKSAVQLAVLSDPLDLLRPRVPTQLVAIEVATSFFRVHGSLHRTATDPANLEQFLSGHSRRFLAISNATIRCLPNPQFDAKAATVLINTEQVHCWWVAPDQRQ